MPVACARSFCGNHSATVLMQAGKFAASPKPSKTRAIPKVNALVASACPMAARLQTVIAIAKPMRVPNLSSSRPAPSMPNMYASENAVVMLLYSIAVQPICVLQRVRQHAQNLPVHVVDGGGEEEQRAHRPAEVRNAPGMAMVGDHGSNDYSRHRRDLPDDLVHHLSVGYNRS